MGKLLKLICMAAILTLFAGCSNGDDPEPQTVQETWLMTYDDYHAMLDIKEDEKQKYKDLSREVTILRDGDEISLKGIFAEYPDAWVKGTIKGNKVYIGNSQAIGTYDGETVYFHWGCAISKPREYFVMSGIWTDETIAFITSTGNAFISADDGNSMTAGDNQGILSFWYDKDDKGYIYYSEKTGFPDVDIKVNISFRKISAAGAVNN